MTRCSLARIRNVARSAARGKAQACSQPWRLADVGTRPMVAGKHAHARLRVDCAERKATSRCAVTRLKNRPTPSGARPCASYDAFCAGVGARARAGASAAADALGHLAAAAYRLRRGLAPPSEELMTMARVRTCYKCHAPFYKVEGCNKVRLPTAGCPPALLRALTEPRRAACTILATARGGDHGR